MKSVPNQNILKLRELADKLSNNEDNEYKNIVIKLKSIIDSGKYELEDIDSPEKKIRCYETMCKKITTVLTSINFI